jgi:hypothetical protein
MKRSTLVGLSVCALVLGACASIQTQQVAPQLSQEVSPLPEPPPWNSLEMMWMETEIVRINPSASPISS